MEDPYHWEISPPIGLQQLALIELNATFAHRKHRAMSEEKLTYERAYAELEQIMQGLQENKVGVDELARHVKRAVELITFCNEMLRATEEEVEGLVKKLEE